MTENYLHFLWKLKRLPFHQLRTTSGEEIHILSTGIHNTQESGPDFFNARILFQGIHWAGQIEMHLKSSDWYKHKHQHDAAYNNVILHVVLEHDQEVSVNDAILPTIELKSHVDYAHFEKWQMFAKAMKDISCEDSIHNLNPIYFKSMIHRAVVDRLNRKQQLIHYHHHQLDPTSIIYHLLGQAFGTKTNAIPFELLCNHLPIANLNQFNAIQKNALLLETSGLFPVNQKVKTPTRIHRHIWKRKGLRPPAFPEIRIQQFSAFIAVCDFDLLTTFLRPQEAYNYMSTLVTKLNQELKTPISSNLFEQLLINAIAPYYWHQSIVQENEHLQSYVLELLQTIKPEDNYIIKRWKQLQVRAKNAYESQALIELYNEMCLQKKCLSCQVGIKILKDG